MQKYQFPQQEQRALERLRQPFAVYQFVDRRVVTLVLSDGFCRLFGYEDRTKAYYDMDNDMYKDAHPDDVARIANAAVRFATEGGTYEVIYRTRKKNRTDYVVVHAMGEHVYTDDGVRLAHVWYTDEGTYVGPSSSTGLEITQTMSNALHEQSMLKASQYDFLTGLPNMTYFFELAEAAKKTMLNQGGQPMLLYIDFSGMKFFNSKHGFAEGDRMLHAFAKLLAGAFSNENCCRIGADHFAVIAEEAGLEDRLNALFRDFGKLYGGKTPPVHVGIYPYRIEDIPVSSACDRAKLACKAVRSAYVSGYNFMKAKVEQFQKLDFPVWLDDFGSGYSSVDVMQSIRFDLIKFDMSFMRKLDEGHGGRVILTELMRMATLLGVDTICEGVEAQAQVRFLQEIGCSKLQG